MTSTSTTPDLDEKKTDSSSSTKTQTINIKGFIISLISLFIFIFLYFSFSGINLYLSKLSQANILPTDIKCFPYTDHIPSISQIISNIFYATNENGENMSMKIQFDIPFNDTKSKHSFIQSLQKYKGTPQQPAHFLARYFIEIMESLMQLNYVGMTTYFNSLNSLPETVCVLISPILTGFFLMFAMFVEFFYFIFIWFYCMQIFFEKDPTSQNNNSNETNKREKIELMSDPVNYMIAIAFAFLFFIILTVIIGAIPIISIIVFIICVFTVMDYKAHFINSQNEKGMKATISVIINNIFKYYKGTIATLFSVFFISNIITYLGTIPGIISIIVIILIFFNKLGIPIFKTNIPESKYLSKIIEVYQANRTCTNNETSTKSPPAKGLLGLFKKPSPVSQPATPASSSVSSDVAEYKKSPPQSVLSASESKSDLSASESKSDLSSSESKSDLSSSESKSDLSASESKSDLSASESKSALSSSESKSDLSASESKSDLSASESKSDLSSSESKSDLSSSSQKPITQSSLLTTDADAAAIDAANNVVPAPAVSTATNMVSTDMGSNEGTAEVGSTNTANNDEVPAVTPTPAAAIDAAAIDAAAIDAAAIDAAAIDAAAIDAAAIDAAAIDAANNGVPTPAAAIDAAAIDAAATDMGSNEVPAGDNTEVGTAGKTSTDTGSNGDNTEVVSTDGANEGVPVDKGEQLGGRRGRGGGGGDFSQNNYFKSKASSKNIPSLNKKFLLQLNKYLR